MKNQDFNFICSLLLSLVFVFGCIGWALNIYKLIECNFTAPYKAESIRTLGVFVPVLGAITGYIDIDD